MSLVRCNYQRPAVATIPINTGKLLTCAAMQKIDGKLLNVSYVEDPSFSDFVVLEVLSSVVTYSLQDLLDSVDLSLWAPLLIDF